MNSHRLNLKEKLLSIGWRAFAVMVAFVATSVSATAQQIIWAQPAAVFYGTELHQLVPSPFTAQATAPGSIIYYLGSKTLANSVATNSNAQVASGPNVVIKTGVLLNAGSYTLIADFIPVGGATDAPDAAVTLTVNPAPLTVTLISRRHPYGHPDRLEFVTNQVGSPNIFEDSNADRTVTGRTPADSDLGVRVRPQLGGVLTNSVPSTTAPDTYPLIVDYVDPNNKLPNYTVTVRNEFLNITAPRIKVRVADSKSKVYGDPDPTWNLAQGNVIEPVFTNGLIVYWQSGDFQFVANTAGGESASTTSGEFGYRATAFAPIDLITVTNTIINNDGSSTTTVTTNVAPGVITQLFTAARVSGENVGTRNLRVDQGTLTSNYRLIKIDENQGGTGPQTGNNATRRSWLASGTETDTVGTMDEDARVLSIQRRQITVRANNQTKAFLADVPPLTGSVSNVVAGDNITAVFTTPATKDSPVGNYPITVAQMLDPGFRLTNYDVAETQGVLTVGRTPLTLNVNSFDLPFNVAPEAFLGFDIGVGVNLGSSGQTAGTSLHPDNKNIIRLRTFGSETPRNIATVLGLIGDDNATNAFATLALITRDASGNQVDINAGSPIGVYSLEPSVIVSQNYSVIITNRGTITIGRTAVPQLAFAGKTNLLGPFEYGRRLNNDDVVGAFSAPEIGGQPISGFYTNFTVLSDAGAPIDLSRALPAGTNRLTATFVVTGPDTNNFANANITTAAVITPKLLVMGAPSLSVAYGDPTPNLEPNFDSDNFFIEGEGLPNLDVRPIIISTRLPSSQIINTNENETFANRLVAASNPRTGAFGTTTIVGGPTSVGPDYRVFFQQVPRSRNYNIRLDEGLLTHVPSPLTVSTLNQIARIGAPAPTPQIAFGRLPDGTLLPTNGFKLGQNASNLGGEAVAVYAGLETDLQGRITSPQGSYPVMFVSRPFARENEYVLEFREGILTVAAQEEPVIAWANPAPIAFGTSLSAAQLNATANTTGTFTYNPPPGTVLNVGENQPLTVTFTPTGPNAGDFTEATLTRFITITPAPTTITWPQPANIEFGTALGAAQLNADSGGIAGTFNYSPGAGATLPVGTHTITATFIPTSANNAPATVTRTITVTKANPVITWTPPPQIPSGTALSSAHLNATANTTGTFFYSPSIGTVLPNGTHTLQLIFVPDDTTNYNVVQPTRSIVVGPIVEPPVINTPPASQSVATGANVTFSVVATGATSYQWRKDGVNIAGATSATLTLNNVQTANAGSYLVVASNSVGSATSSPATLTVTPPPTTTVVKGDINGDGRADILFQDNQGFLAAWLMNGVNLTSAAFLLPSNIGDLNYRIAATGDFNGDGREDILFQANDGTLAVWTMNGVVLSSAVLLNPSHPGDVNWRVVGTGDINNDSRVDILFQHTNGTLAVWYMNGTTLSSAALINPSHPGDANWKVAGVGDLNGNGNQDIVFQHTDGTLAAWLMNGANLTSAALLSTSHPGDAGWRVVGVADRNADNRADLLFQHTNTALAVWFMNGTTLTSAQMLNPSSSGSTWRVVAPK